MSEQQVTKSDIACEWTIICGTAPLDDITSLDLRNEAKHLDRMGILWEFSRFSVRGQSTMVDVLYVVDVDRAGIAWGADADWTDADDAQDGVERYFGIDGKEMQP